MLPCRIARHESNLMIYEIIIRLIHYFVMVIAEPLLQEDVELPESGTVKPAIFVNLGRVGEAKLLGWKACQSLDPEYQYVGAHPENAAYSWDSVPDALSQVISVSQYNKL